LCTASGTLYCLLLIPKHSEEAMSHSLSQLLTRTTAAEVVTLLDDDVVFHSPVADYRGRADVAHLLAAIASCISTPEPSEELRGTSSTATTFVAAVDEARIDGVLVQRCTEDGLLVEATLLLRPLAVLKTAIAGMRAALAADPLPSAR
jgi:hypothetical protein